MRDKFKQPFQSFHSNESIRQKWREDYTVPHKYVDLNESTEKRVKSVVLPENTSFSHKAGDQISAIEAINKTFQGLDIRPKVFDDNTKQWVLLDSGSCVSCIPAGPNDVLDPSFKLKSVNGGIIETYGSKTMSFRIGKKSYSIEAIIAAVPSPIFGWDIFDKYQLSLDWNKFGELILKDNKSNNSSVLKHELISEDSIPRIQEIQSESLDSKLFELQCMKRLDNFINSIQIEESEEPFVEANLPLSPEADPDYGEDEKLNLEALKKIDEKWSKLIKKVP